MNTITTTNVDNVRNLIRQKQNMNTPFYSTIDGIKNIITDQDHFPYTRYYRGVPYLKEPVIFERETGVREIKNECYNETKHYNIVRPNYCFKPACSTTFPCYPKDVDSNSTNFSKNCIAQYY